MQPDPLNWLSRAIETAADVAVYPLLLILAVAVLWLAIDAARRYIRDRLDVVRPQKSQTQRRRGVGERAAA